MHTSTLTGSAKWLSVTEHATASGCVAALKAQGYRVLASDLKPGTEPLPIQEVDWAGQKVAVVMGNEERGITDEMRVACDGTYYVPMKGFAESFNLSVGTAVTLAFLDSLGGLKHGDLPQGEKELLYLRWLIKSVPQGAAILRREGLLKDEGDVAEAAKGSKTTIMGFKLR
jgi:tRNA (guanosine-2'-O-)-methyltransferase